VDADRRPLEARLRVTVPGVPGYWMNEVSGLLEPVVRKYLNNQDLNQTEVALMRAYLRQWVNATGFVDVADLRARVDSLTTTDAIREWLADAYDTGIDPL
jgi:hypothetical protein